MKNILIIYPQWPPSNLAGVHRPRLISNFLPDYGYHPIVLTVDEYYYEEELDYEFLETVSPKTEVIKVGADPVKNKNRIIGDVGIRAFKQLKEKAIELIRNRDISFLWVPIPSYYCAVIARQVFNKTHTPYGIDYIDPWVKPKDVAGSFLSKAWLSNQVAKILEPYSVKKAVLISGVDTSYYQPVLDRNFKNTKIDHIGMPYGFDPKDHEIQLSNIELPWDSEKEDAYLYAGALLPKSIYFLKTLFSVIRDLRANQHWEGRNKLYFIGTRTTAENSVLKYAKEYGIEDVVVEIPERRPFLHILYFLSKAKGVIVLGSTEEHYTASKIFQSILSKRPIFPIFHRKSSAIEILGLCKAEKYLVRYDEGINESIFEKKVLASFTEFIKCSFWQINMDALNVYSASVSTEKLVSKLNLFTN